MAKERALDTYIVHISIHLLVILKKAIMRQTGFILLLMCFIIGSYAEATGQADFHLLIGTYATENSPNGIHVYNFNVESGLLEQKQPVTELANASFLAISADKKNVYAVSGDKVNAYAFNSTSGKLTFINSVATQGSCYVSVDSNKKVVFSGNYGGGNVLAIKLNKDGAFDEGTTQIVQHYGKSINTERQESAHVHSVVLSPDENFLLVPDLGVDKIYQYQVRPAQKTILKPAQKPFLATEIGGGPRHLVFHPNGKYAYVVLELQGAVKALRYKNGTLKAMQTTSMVTPNFEGRLSGADIHVSPDGKFLYASNRGNANEIAIYAINKKGKLNLLDRQSVMGEMPRNFAIDPTGKYILVANQNSNEVVIFKRDAITGLMTPTGDRLQVDKPVCLKFASIGE